MNVAPGQYWQRNGFTSLFLVRSVGAEDVRLYRLTTPSGAGATGTLSAARRGITIPLGVLLAEYTRQDWAVASVACDDQDNRATAQPA